jgi:hypothetical protein
MYKHKPIPKTDVKIEEDKPSYKCNAQGIVMLPDIYPQFNPIEEVKKEKKKVERKPKESS